MSESSPGYLAGRPEPEHQWVECSVRVPNPDREGESEIQCQAKVRCDDVIDALALDRWSAVAFQHLWRAASATAATTRQRELSLAVWYLKRATSGHHAEGRAVARVLRKLVDVAQTDERDPKLVLLEFARDAEACEFGAIELIHEAATQDN